MQTIKIQNTRQQPKYLKIKRVVEQLSSQSWCCLHRRWLSWCGRSVVVVHSHMLNHFLYHLHISKLVLCHGYLRYMMFVKFLRITSTMCQTRIGMSIRARKTAQTVSSTRIFARSGENSTENLRLLFCTEKIILSHELSKRYRIKRMVDLQLRGR